MDITLDLLESRHSVRSYSTEEITSTIINTLKSEITYINSHEPGLNFQLCLDQPAAFEGFKRSYGAFRNVKNYLAAIIDPSFDNALERAGYFAEQFVIKCTELGLGTCFVGGTFSREDVATRLEVYEKLPFVVTFGYPEENKTTLIGKFSRALLHIKTRKPRDFYEGDDFEYQNALAKFPWLSTAIDALACAPSALNKQPVRLKMVIKESLPEIVAFTKNNSPVDLGIAKFNIASILHGSWEWGEDGVFQIND